VNWSTCGSENDDGYIAIVPSCRAPPFGGTPEALVHGRMRMKGHRDTQSRGFAWPLGSFGNFGLWRRPRPQQNAQSSISSDDSYQIVGKYATRATRVPGRGMLGDDDQGYIAGVPDLPCRSAFGETPEAAVHEIGDAVEAWTAACRASGDPIPESTTKARQVA
jgi:predicted RNase H-like HicB family nuclease